MSDDIEHFFIYLFAMSGEVSVQIFSPFLSWPVCFPSVAFLSSLYILDISPLSDIYIANISPQSVLSFHSLNSVFCRAEVLYFKLTTFFFPTFCFYPCI